MKEDGVFLLVLRCAKFFSLKLFLGKLLHFSTDSNSASNFAFYDTVPISNFCNKIDIFGMGKLGRWVAKLVARLLATAALWVRIQTPLRNTKWAT